MSPAPPHVHEPERVQGPLTLSETCTWPDAPARPNPPSGPQPPPTASARATAAAVVAGGPAGVGGGGGAGAGAAWKTAPPASQWAAAPKVAVPCWAPAALDVMSSANAEPFEFCARGVYGTPALLPGVTERGSSPVIKAANTSSPASTAAVAPVSTVVPIPRADATWSSAPARAMPE